MKNLAIIIVLLFVSTQITFAGSYKRICKNGGEKGYNFSKITVDDNGNTELIYKDRGYEKPVTAVSEKTKPNIPTPVQVQVNAFIEQFVAGGKLKGTGTFVFENTNYQYSWKYKTANGYTSKVVITD